MYINKKYLDLTEIKRKTQDFNNHKPINYLVFDDFINADFFDSCSEELETHKKISIDKKDKENSHNKTIYVEGKSLLKLDAFLNSVQFEKYISIFMGVHVKREFYINKDKTGYNEGLIAQLYEKDDYYDWHIDGSDRGESLGSFIYYLSGYPEGAQNYGGELQLGTGTWGDLHPYKTFYPQKNRLILIGYSQTAFHRVKPVLSDIFKRISIQATLLKTNKN